MEQDIQKILITEEQIQRRIAEMGQELTREYADKFPVIVGVLKGVVVFFADMVRQIKVPCQMDFLWISSYQGTDSTGQMVVKRDVGVDVKGRHVLILEDIYDTGNSLDFTVRHLLEKQPAQDPGERELRVTVPENLNYGEIFDDLFEVPGKWP